ncbi:MAG TPA: hypothetical protein VNU44_22275 [Bryobacteraceae bacterium]|nr:hypothetical protein [Bryobacteraceae bacterium]
MKSSISAALFALNAFLCWPLFRIEYLDQFPSNEGSWITFAKFLRENWPHVSWFPWFNAGMPFENSYLPGVSVMVAVVSMVAHCSPAHAIHVIAALAYSLAPVSLFLFAREISGRIAPGAWAAVLWSLFSPSIIIPTLFLDLNTHFGLRRLRNIVVFGETPHNVAICLLPIALLLTWRYLERPTARRFALAALASAAVMFTNAFGLVAVVLSSVILCATGKSPSWKQLASVGGIQLAAYLVVCRFLPPSLIRVLERNSQFVGGDYRFTPRTMAFAGCLLAILVVLWASSRFLSNPILQFAILFSVCFGGIAFFGFEGINLLPQPLRYHLEMEPGLCLLAVFLLEPMVRWMPGRLTLAATLLCIAPLIWVGARDWDFSRRLIQGADITHSLPYREARWIAANLPGQRVLVSSQGQYLFNLFAGNPQMSAGHEPSVPNLVQLLAIGAIYEGRDGPISVLWLKAFGCGAIVVPGRDSEDHFHWIENPEKFEGLLPLLWRESGESIYQVPQRSASLAHVIPRSAVVRAQPGNGELQRYVDALESVDMPPASIVWENPDHARITAKMDSSEVLSVQMTYDPGWEARIGNRKVTTSADKLGFILIEPGCSDCSIDLEFTGGLERKIALAVSLLVFSGLVTMLFWRPAHTHL